MKLSNDSKLMNPNDIDLSKAAVFKGIPKEKLAKITAIMSIKNFPTGQLVFKEGESGDSIYVLLEGEVEVSKSLSFHHLSAQAAQVLRTSILVIARSSNLHRKIFLFSVKSHCSTNRAREVPAYAQLPPANLRSWMALNS